MSRKLQYPTKLGICLTTWLTADLLLKSGKYVCSQAIVDYLHIPKEKHKQTVEVELAYWRKYHGLDRIGKR